MSHFVWRGGGNTNNVGADSAVDIATKNKFQLTPLVIGMSMNSQADDHGQSNATFVGPLDVIWYPGAIKETSGYCSTVLVQ